MADSIRELLETPDPFRRWLEGQDATHVVGRSRERHACPLQRFLVAQLGMDDGLEVYAEEVRRYVDGKLVSEPLPDWARAFVALIDRRA